MEEESIKQQQTMVSDHQGSEQAGYLYKLQECNLHETYELLRRQVKTEISEN